MNWRQEAESAVVTAPPKVESEDAFLAQQLNALLEDGAVRAGSKDFASSLLNGFAKYRAFTDRQRPYVKKLIAEASAPVEEQRKSAAMDLDLSRVPAGRYAVETRRIQIDKPDAGKWEGWVFVKDGSEYGAGRRIATGRPNWNGQVEINASTRMTADRRDLETIIANPLEASKQYGRITSTCGVCGRTLENPESVAFGVGPICAEKF